MAKKKLTADDIDRFGRRRTFGCPIDIARLEYQVSEGAFHGSNQTFLDSAISSILEMCERNGNPRTDMIRKEDKIEEDRRRNLISSWLSGAMGRLPKDQETCICLKFRLDMINDSDNVSSDDGLRTEQEIATIVGRTHQTVSRHLIAGMKNLKKDFHINLRPHMDSFQGKSLD